MNDRDIRAVLRAMLPPSSEFRPGEEDDRDDAARAVRRGRRVTVPNSIVPNGFFDGTQWIDPNVQPSPTSCVRRDVDPSLPTTVYVAWDYCPDRPPPQEPDVYVLVRWGVGGVTYERQIDVHRGIARRLALAANWVEVIALYSDESESIPERAAVDLLVGIASGPCDPNFWTGTWVPRPLIGSTDLQTITSQPTGVLAVSGTILSLPPEMPAAYVLLIDTAEDPMFGDKCLPGGCSPLLSAGDSFAMADTDEPALFCDWGLGWALSTDPRVVVTPTGTAPARASVALKIVVASIGSGAPLAPPPPPT